MNKYFLVNKLPNGNFEVIQSFENINDAIELLSTNWVTQWANGFIFIFENIPLKIEVG